MARRLVVDTDVGHAAGSSNDPIAAACSAVLARIYQGGFTVLMTPEMNAEWKRHESGYTKDWRLRMEVKDRILYQSLPPNQRLRETLEAVPLTPAQRAILDKDIHLLEAAMAADHPVISKDEKVRRVLCVCCSRIPELETIVWVNPVLDAPILDHWFANACRPQPELCLSYYGRSSQEP